MPDKKFKSQNRNTRDAEFSDDLFSFESSSSDTPISNNELNAYAEISQPIGVPLTDTDSKSTASVEINLQKKENLRRQLHSIKSRDNVSKRACADPKTRIQEPLLHPEFNAWMSVMAVALHFGVSKSTIWRWAKYDQSFPKCQKFGKGTTRWSRGEIEAYRRPISSGEETE